MPITLDGTNGITTPTYGGADTSEYLVPVTQFKNRIINGAMVIDQRNAGAAVNNITGAGFFITDRWKSMAVNTWGGSGVVFSGQQNRDSLTPPSGFTNYLGIATTTQSTSLPASTTLDLTQVIEGFNVADLGWGTANAKSVTLSFWARSNLTGTFGGSLINSAYNRVYVFSYTISAADTWEYKTVTITGDTSGTWVTNNGIGITLSFSLGAGSSMMTTPGSWGSSLVSAPTGQQQICASTSNRFYVTGVQLEVGSTATSFDYRPYTIELTLCQRYYFKIGGNSQGNSNYQAFGAGSMQAGNTSANIYLPFKQTMRATPTITYAGNVGITSQGSYVNISSLGSGYGGVDSSLVQPSCSAVGAAGYGAVLLANADSTAFLAMSSEL